MVKVDRVEWITIPDQQTQVNALLNGEIDLIEIVPPDLLPLLQKDKNIKIFVTNLAGRQYAMRFNVLFKPFDNAKVRQAVLYALDQKPFLEANVGNPDILQGVQVALPLRLAARIDQGLGGQGQGQRRQGQAAPAGGGL